MSHRILRRARDCRVRHGARVETPARIAKVIHNGALGSYRRNVNHLLWIEAGAVLHGIHQHFAKRKQQVIADAFGKITAHRRHEPGEPLSRYKAARHTQRNPLGPRRQDLDAVTPVNRLRCGPDQISDLGDCKWSHETAKDLRAQSGNDLGSGRGRCQEDGLQAGPDVTGLPEQREILVDVGPAARDHDIEGALTESAQRIERTMRRFHLVRKDRRLRNPQGVVVKNQDALHRTDSVGRQTSR